MGQFFFSKILFVICCALCHYGQKKYNTKNDGDLLERFVSTFDFYITHFLVFIQLMQDFEAILPLILSFKHMNIAWALRDISTGTYTYTKTKHTYRQKLSFVARYDKTNTKLFLYILGIVYIHKEGVVQLV